MLRSFIRIPCSFVFAFGLIATSLAAFLASAAPAPPVKTQLALNWKPEPQFGGFYATLLTDGKTPSIAAKNGLVIDIREGGSGTPTVQMLANGQVDFAIVSAEEILISNDRNPKNPVVALFAVYQTNPQMIMCHADRGLKSLGEVYASDSTMALQSGLTYAQFLKKKYPSAKARIVPYLGGIANYLADAKYCQQGFATSEPLSAAKAGQPAQVFLVADEGFNPYTTVVATRAETLKTKPDLVKAMVRSVRDGWEAYLKNPAETNAHMGRLNKAMDADTFGRSAEAQKSLIETSETKSIGIGGMKKERWETLAAQLRDLKTIKTLPKVDEVYRTF